MTATRTHKPMTRRTWTVRGNAMLDVASVTVSLIRTYHGEPGDAFWAIETTDGNQHDPQTDRRADVRDGIASVLRAVRADMRESILDAAADRARDLLETLIDSGDALKALAALESIR